VRTQGCSTQQRWRQAGRASVLSVNYIINSRRYAISRLFSGENSIISSAHTHNVLEYSRFKAPASRVREKRFEGFEFHRVARISCKMLRLRLSGFRDRSNTTLSSTKRTTKSPHLTSAMRARRVGACLCKYIRSSLVPSVRGDSGLAAEAVQLAH
jgi:hypothetical protein